MKTGYPAGMIVLLHLLLWGCGLQEIKRQTEVVENSGLVSGHITVQSQQQGPVVVLLFEDQGGILALKGRVIATATGEYQFTAKPGTYAVAAFIDVNRNGAFERGQEHGNFNTDPLTFEVTAQQTAAAKTIAISGDPPQPPSDKQLAVDESAAAKNIGTMASLSDPMFVRDNYNMGMWRPVDFLAKVGGGLFFLQEYAPQKIPVLFVHGIAGGPTDLQGLIESLDKERFQAWILYYPSGLRLDMISDYLVTAVTNLQNKHKFNQFIVVAHSMGGLITRSFVKKYTQRFPERTNNVRLVMTINSPMGGMPSATSGVKHSPIVVPSWRDVADGSEFLTDLHAWVWPREIPYYLVFSYEAGEDNDGIVGLNSQIPLKLQSEATRVFGFNNTHVGTVNDDAFVALFNEILTSGEQGGKFIDYVVKGNVSK